MYARPVKHQSAATATTLESPKTTRERTSKDDSTKVDSWGWLAASPAKLAAGALFGVIFGFLLQKGGAAKFDILIGVLLLENFVVVKIMLSAIIVGMVGGYFLRRYGVVERQIKETKLGSNVVGGLIFGVGFGLLAYCPGTNAAAIGQGNFDAWIGVLGLLLGSYAFALSSRFSSGKIAELGNLGKVTVPELIRVSEGVFIAIAAPVLVAILVLIEILTR